MKDYAMPGRTPGYIYALRGPNLPLESILYQEVREYALR